jgi:hypothetical protein
MKDIHGKLPIEDWEMGNRCEQHIEELYVDPISLWEGVKEKDNHVEEDNCALDMLRSEFEGTLKDL